MTSPSPLIEPRAFTSAHNTLLSDSSIQFDLPMRPPDPPSPPDPPGWMQWLADFFGSDHPFLRLVLWGIAALIAAWILWMVARWLMGADWPWRRRGAGADDDGDESWRPEAATARTLLGQADALAAAGRYSEAAHLLLFRSIEDVDERRPAVIRKSLTARDIAALPIIPDRPRSAFARIALAVERAFFARRDLGEAEWRDCRAAYEEFAFAEAWG